MQVIRNRQVYDVCIVGSGAGGGMAAKVLTEAGAQVLMLEAGPTFDTGKDGFMFKWAYETPRRGAAIPTQQFGEFDAAFGGWTIEGEPYTNAPGSVFDWFRSRMLGGRTNHWGRISLRYGPNDFRRKSLDGLGDDWPITYEDMKPYYDKVDRLVGIFGSNENLPNDPDGIFQPPPKPRCYELLIKQAADKLKITCVAEPVVRPDEAAQRSPCMPLLRPVQPRMCHPFQLPVADGAHHAGTADRAPQDHPQRHGARGHDGRYRVGDRRVVHRQEYGTRKSRAREDRGACRQRM